MTGAWQLVAQYNYLMTGHLLTGDLLPGENLPGAWLTGAWFTGAWLTGDWMTVTGDWLTGAWWTFGALSIQKAATTMGLTPGSIALWGGAPIIRIIR